MVFVALSAVIAGRSLGLLPSAIICGRVVNEFKAIVDELGGEQTLGRHLSSDRDLREAIHEGFLIQDRLPPRTAHIYQEFRICPSCDRLYWAGSHHEHMQRFLERILSTRAGSYGILAYDGSGTEKDIAPPAIPELSF